MTWITSAAILVVLVLGFVSGVQMTVLRAQTGTVLGDDPVSGSLFLAAVLAGFAGGLVLAARSAGRIHRPMGFLACCQVVSIPYAFALPYLLQSSDSTIELLQRALPPGVVSLGLIFIAALPVTGLAGASLAAAMQFVQRRDGAVVAFLAAGSAVLFGVTVGGIAGSAWMTVPSLAVAGLVASLLAVAVAVGAAILSYLGERSAFVPSGLGAVGGGTTRLGWRSGLWVGAVGGLLGLEIFLLVRLVGYRSGTGLPGGDAAGPAAWAAIGLGLLAALGFQRHLVRWWDAGKVLVVVSPLIALDAIVVSHAIHSGFVKELFASVPGGLGAEVCRDLGFSLIGLIVPGLLIGIVVSVLALPGEGFPAWDTASMSVVLGVAMAGAGAFLALYCPILMVTGLQGGIVLVACGLALLGAGRLGSRRALGAALAVLLLYVFAEPLELPAQPGVPEARIIQYQECPWSASAVLSVPQGDSSSFWLTSDGYLAAHPGWSRDEQLLAHVLLLLCSAEPESALLIGFGSGAALGVLRDDPLVQRVTILLRSVSEETVRTANRSNCFGGRGETEREKPVDVTVARGDHRAWLRSTDERWPVILAHLLGQAGPGPQADLVSDESLRQIRQHLSAGGLFGLWVPMGLPAEVLEHAGRRYARHFPDAQVWFFEPGGLLLLGGRGPFTVLADKVRARWSRDGTRRSLIAQRLGDMESVLGSRVCALEVLCRNLAPRITAPATAWDLSSVFRRMHAGAVPDVCRRENLELLAGVVEEQPLPMESGDGALDERVRRSMQALHHLILGLSLARNEQEPAGGEEEFGRGLAACPGDTRLVDVLERAKMAKPAVPAAVRPGPSSGSRATWADHNRRGNAALERGALPLALKEYREAERLAPERDEPKLNMARVMVFLGRHEEALDVYRGILDRNPDHVRTLVREGAVLTKMERFEEAERSLQRALGKAPEDPLAHHHLANLWQRMGRTEDAIAEYQSALRFKEDYAEAIYDFAECLYGEEEFHPALQLFRRYLKLAPQSDKAKQVRDLVRILERRPQRK